MKKRAFTLIEVLVVMAIITVIAVMGAGAYSLAQQGITLDLAGDTIVGQLHGLRGKAQAQSRCFGMRFIKNHTPEIIEMPLRDRVHGCGNIDKLIQMPLRRTVAIGELTTEGTIPTDRLTVIFGPPYGAMQIVPNARTATLTVLNEKNPSSRRVITLNAETGGIEK